MQGGWDDFTEMSGPRDLSKIFETPEYVKWRSFRGSEDSRYVGLCVFLRPHFQLDELTVSLPLVAELPKPAGEK